MPPAACEGADHRTGVDRLVLALDSLREHGPDELLLRVVARLPKRVPGDASGRKVIRACSSFASAATSSNDRCSPLTSPYSAVSRPSAEGSTKSAVTSLRNS